VTGVVGRPPEILFVCVQNAGRSQIAAALLRHLGGDRVVVRSAGSSPAAEIHGNVAAVLREMGLDVSGEIPTRLENDALRTADLVITMGCGDTCPVVPGKRYEDWKVPDPSGKPIDAVRDIREEIRGRVLALLYRLGISPAEPAA
jgi:arsenate reductase (thioredoxin)